MKNKENGVINKLLIAVLGVATLASVGFGPMKIIDAIKEKLDKDNHSSYVLPHDDKDKDNKDNKNLDGKQNGEEDKNYEDVNYRNSGNNKTNDSINRTYENNKQSEVNVNGKENSNFEFNTASTDDITIETTDTLPEDNKVNNDIFVSESDLREAEEILSQELNGNKQNEPLIPEKVTGTIMEFDEMER